MEIDYVYKFVRVIGSVALYMLMAHSRGKFLELHNECHAIWKTCTVTEHWTVNTFMRKTKSFLTCFFIICIVLNAYYSFTAFAVRLQPIELNSPSPRMFSFRSLNK